MVKPLREQDLVFPSAATNVDALARRINKADTSQSIRARLLSIDEDAKFVRRVASQKKLPLIANERCGGWYVPPDLKFGSSYFKSTDGHAGQWAFSLRRLNLELLGTLSNHGGCIIVDSTRRGKHAPDALSKTIPIWCAVLNSVVFTDHKNTHRVRLHERLVGDSEQEQINARIHLFTQQVTKILDVESLRSRLHKPLKPYWIVRSLPYCGAMTSDTRDVYENDHYPIYLCMASEYREAHGTDHYIQGAGDDSESWAHGLTPQLFWTHYEKLVSSVDIHLPKIIQDILSSTATPGHTLTCISSFPRLWVGSLEHEQHVPMESARIIVSPQSDLDASDKQYGRKRLCLRCAPGKNGSRDLRRELEKIPEFLESSRGSDRIAILCPTGKDFCIGVCLAVVVFYGDDAGTVIHTVDVESTLTIQGEITLSHRNNSIDKVLIKRKLAKIMTDVPHASPSRATLTAVNSFVMKPPS